MAHVYSAATLIDAQLVVDELAAGGMQAEITGRYLSGAIGELPPGDVIGVRLLQPRHEERARALIAEWEATRQRPGPDWTCPRCRERLGGAFGACWQCGGAAPR